jgi:hypothetical protein
LDLVHKIKKQTSGNGFPPKGQLSSKCVFLHIQMVRVPRLIQNNMPMSRIKEKVGKRKDEGGRLQEQGGRRIYKHVMGVWT